MTWLHEHGVISSFADYEDLPLVVLEDARMVMLAEAQRQERADAMRKRR